MALQIMFVMCLMRSDRAATVHTGNLTGERVDHTGAGERSRMRGYLLLYTVPEFHINDRLMGTCMYCGSSVRQHKSDNKHYMQCHTREISRQACMGAFIPLAELERTILNEVRSLNQMLLDQDKVARSIDFETALKQQRAKVEAEKSSYQEKVDEFAEAIRQLYIDKTAGLISPRDYFEMSEGFQVDKVKFEGLIRSCEERIRDLDMRIEIGDNREELLARYVDLDHLTRNMTEVLIDHVEIGRRCKESGKVPVTIFWNF